MRDLNCHSSALCSNEVAPAPTCRAGEPRLRPKSRIYYSPLVDRPPSKYLVAPSVLYDNLFAAHTTVLNNISPAIQNNSAHPSFTQIWPDRILKSSSSASTSSSPFSRSCIMGTRSGIRGMLSLCVLLCCVFSSVPSHFHPLHPCSRSLPLPLFRATDRLIRPACTVQRTSLPLGKASTCASFESCGSEGCRGEAQGAEAEEERGAGGSCSSKRG